MRIDNKSLDELMTLYNALTAICDDYSRMTDGYTLSTGDSTFENLPDEVKVMIKERQEFFFMKRSVLDLLKIKVAEAVG